MKLLLLTRSLNEGGAERQIVTMARALAARGRAPVVAVFYSGGVLEADLCAAGVPVRHIGKRGRWDLATFSARAAALVRAERPDVVYSMLPTANLVASSLKLATPGLRVVWGIRASNMDFGDYDSLNSITLWLQRVLAPTADAIIVNSHAGRRDLLAAGYGDERIKVVLNGVDTSSFARDELGRRRVRSDWNVRDDEPLVGIVARFDPMKDHRNFFRAAAQVAVLLPSTRFVCVGTGTAQLCSVALAQAQSAGIADRIIWAGARADMARVYSALDLCVLSSAYGEGFPNVLGEAMACGTPCVSTQVGDAEVILQGWGALVPPREPGLLAEAIRSALELDVTEAWRAAARGHIAANFSVDALLLATESVLCPGVTEVADAVS
jgi:glycosyltransferase involved in cell wall biosynthesis